LVTQISRAVASEFAAPEEFRSTSWRPSVTRSGAATVPTVPMPPGVSRHRPIRS